MIDYLNPYHIDSVRKVILKCFDELENQLKKSPLIQMPESDRLLSMSLIGRNVEERRIDSVMDFDFVIIINGNMSEEKLHEIEKIFDQLQNFSTDLVDIQYMIADGPIKPILIKKFCLFFHVILHTKHSYISSPLKLVKNSWRYDAKHLYGEKLINIDNYSEPTVDELFNTPLGINHCIELIEKQETSYLKWEQSVEQPELVPMQFDEYCEILEICYYSVLRGASNGLRYILGISNDIGIELKDVLLFKQVFSDYDYADTPLNVYFRKIDLRQNMLKVSSSLVEMRIAESIVFLNKLKSGIIERKEFFSRKG